MSTLGKILIVMQVIMSFLFMCAAGAVYTVQRNWKAQHDQAQRTIGEQREDYDVQIEELNKQVDELTARAQEQENRADEAEGLHAQLEMQVQNLTRANNSLEQQVSVADGVAESAASESAYRREEAEQQRVVNQTLRESLNRQSQEIVRLQDENFTLQVASDNLNNQYLSLLEQFAFLQRVVSKHGLSTDPRDVEGLNDPPPPVDGLVLETRKDRTNRTEFAHVSIGSDDGLLVGHELDVYRTAEQNGGDPQYLGRIRIVHLLPDEAVGMVVEAAKNGIIEEGDNVTTRL